MQLPKEFSIGESLYRKNGDNKKADAHHVDN